MLRKDCHKPYWKEKFIHSLPPIFAHKVKQELMGKNDSIDYDNLTYGDIFITMLLCFRIFPSAVRPSPFMVSEPLFFGR